MQARGVSQPTTSSDMVIGPVHVVPAALSDYSVFSNTERPLAFMASIPSGEGASFHSVTFSHLRNSQGSGIRQGRVRGEGTVCCPGGCRGSSAHLLYGACCPLGSGSGGAPSMADTVTRWPPIRGV